MRYYYDWFESPMCMSLGSLRLVSNEAVEEDKAKRSPIGFQIPKPEAKPKYRHTQIYPKPK